MNSKGSQIRTDPGLIPEVNAGVKDATTKACQFASTEEYIAHRLKNHERWLNFKKGTGKLIGDGTIGIGIIMFAPSAVVPFIVAGYIRAPAQHHQRYPQKRREGETTP